MSAHVFYVADGVNLVEHRASDGKPLRSVPLKWFMAAPEMLALLRDIEWSGPAADGTKRPSCPDCGALRQSGHDHVCKLGSLLARIDGAAKG